MGRLPIVYRLSDPGYTIYHRAALGGLAATIRSWGDRGRGVRPPLSFVKDRATGGGTLRDDKSRGVNVSLSASTIELSWEDSLTDREALALILRASFLRTDQGLIFLPGQGFGRDREDMLIASHNALSQSFLQHNKKRPGVGQGQVIIEDDDGETHSFTYKKVDRYSHQIAQASGLLTDGEGWDVETGDLPDEATLTQASLPGAMQGARPLRVAPLEAFLLQFLMVACPVFSVRSRKWEAKVRSCLVIPDVSNLETFSSRLENVGTTQIRLSTNSYLGRIAGGAEEAAMRFLMDLRGTDTIEGLGVSGAQVVAMGKVAWDNNQQNRSRTARVRTPEEYADSAIFEAAAGTLGGAKVITTKKGEKFAIPGSPLPDLIAANLAAEKDWYDGFRDLVAKKKDFVDLGYRREGLKAMLKAIQDGVDQLVIRLFQEAWEIKRNALSNRAVGDHVNYGTLGDAERKRISKEYWRLVDAERERIRNGVLRCKSPDMLLSWLLAFVADARRKEPIAFLSREGEEVRKFLFNPRNVDRLQNLLLFALVSSPSNDPTGRVQRPSQEG